VNGGGSWVVPDEEVHTFVNDLFRPVGAYLCRHRIYETVVGWETMDTAAQAPFTRNFALTYRRQRLLPVADGFSKLLDFLSKPHKRFRVLNYRLRSET